VYARSRRHATSFARLITIDEAGRDRAGIARNCLDKRLRDGQNPYHSLSPLMTPKCKHPIVKVVAREDDTEFVECQSCREIFDSAEFSDIAIEEADTGSEAGTDD
jgi:hypothetical protein